MGIFNEVINLAKTDMFQREQDGTYATGIEVGRPFYIDYDKVNVLVADARKYKANGIPQGCFLLAYYEHDIDVKEAVLLRVIGPAKLPTDNDVIASMIDYYKEGVDLKSEPDKIDSFTRYEMGFSGIECRVLGTFYNEGDDTLFGADLENFFSAHNYTVVKPNVRVLTLLANFRDDNIVGRPTDIEIGKVRYSSSRRFSSAEKDVPVYVTPTDFLGKRTALFGMTRTGKSNTVKTIISACCDMSDKATLDVESYRPSNPLELLEPFTEDGTPKFKSGQLIFDINGEYANPNAQDKGTAIFEIYENRTDRFSTIEKDGFKVMKVNFFKDLSDGFELICSHFSQNGESSHYIGSFTSISLDTPEGYGKNDDEGRSITTRYDRLKAAYICCLYKSGFKVPDNFTTIKFSGNKDLNKIAFPDDEKDPSKGISLSAACTWFENVWTSMLEGNEFFTKYKNKNGKDWADESLKAVLVMLTGKRQLNNSVSGFKMLSPLKGLHTSKSDISFDIDILKSLRRGKIVIVDLSQGDPEIQATYSERICRAIFNDAMENFISMNANNFIQFYFEEAHNLFPKKDDKDLKQIYNRIAKEGAKLNLGMVYATQEVSSISSNILKNTQNWFIAHLNNDDETREIKKYYDFADFTSALTKFSSGNDKGFVRMKTYSSAFVIPVQIHKFPKVHDEKGC
ncbi:ATP-binding protein [Shewanella khirikhana]|uniref:AAA-like domain protein n=1 Tax=Shewanella khirikhana TaxID=1965282 RepID=A0ABM7CYN4_9GAMM|nr:DUF87 domain-containing protein [Shewanella khirikhana]AZQ09208.1 AAA-like domain protein [Shewanella khirikhana]